MCTPRLSCLLIVSNITVRRIHRRSCIFRSCIYIFSTPATWSSIFSPAFSSPAFSAPPLYHVLFRAVCTVEKKRFSPRRKADVDCVFFSSVGSWFHALGAAVENARSAVFRFVRGTTWSPRMASRSEDRDEVAAPGWSKSVM